MNQLDRQNRIARAALVSTGAMLLVFQLGCGAVEGDASDAGDNPAADANNNPTIDAGPTFDAPPGSPDANLQQCTPDSMVCASDVLTVCDSGGNVASTEACSLGCHSGGMRCNDIDPSNGLATHLDDTSTAPDVVLENGATIDTTSGTVMNPGGGIAVPNAMEDGGTRPIGILVLKVKSLTVNGSVAVSGSRALAIVSDGDVIIKGVFSVSAAGVVSGPGAILNSSGCQGNIGSGSGDLWAGGGGGGFGTAGGRGGSAGIRIGGSGGVVAGTAALVPLRGGCPGGNSAGGSPTFPTGAAGGALQIVSRTTISIPAPGVIAANGAGARQENPGLCLLGSGRCAPGVGAGSGGGVLLEAPTVTVIAGAGVVANGGGGACGWGTMGQDGQLTAQPALGDDCTAVANRGNGGSGAAGGTAAQNGSNGSGANAHGGGGGGGVGRIRVNLAAGGSFTPPSGSVVSPTATVGVLDLR